MYTDGQRMRGIKKLPLNLLDALRATQKSRSCARRSATS